jgi:hypothetical protein
MKTIKIAIPSYKRHEIIKSHTLQLLQNYNIPKKHIYIFVSDKDESKLYNESINDNEYNIIIGVLGLDKQRNFITNFFKPGTPILNMDDDLKKISMLDESNNIILLPDLKQFINKAFKMCYTHNSFIWGIHQTQNNKFLRNSITFDLSFIVGYFWGCINRHYPELNITIDIKEDYERTLKYWIKDKTIIKFNYIFADTAIYKTIGGIQFQYPDRSIESIKNTNLLLEQYPEYILKRETHLNSSKKSKYCEIKIKKGFISNNNYYIPLPELNKDDEIIQQLLTCLNNTKLDINYKRLNSGIGISHTFGLYQIRRKCGLHESKNNSKYPEIYNLLLQFYNKYVKLHYPEYTSIQLNKNYITKPHIDKNNRGNSYIVGLGDYTDGNLILNSYKHNIHYKPILFNGSMWIHSTEKFIGNRYSLVFFNLPNTIKKSI